MTKSINSLETLLDLIKDIETVIVKFDAGWCISGRELNEVYEFFAERHQSTTLWFFHCDVDKSPEIAQKFSVEGLPQVLVF